MLRTAVSPKGRVSSDRGKALICMSKQLVTCAAVQLCGVRLQPAGCAMQRATGMCLDLGQPVQADRLHQTDSVFGCTSTTSSCPGYVSFMGFQQHLDCIRRNSYMFHMWSNRTSVHFAASCTLISYMHTLHHAGLPRWHVRWAYANVSCELPRHRQS